VRLDPNGYKERGDNHRPAATMKYPLSGVVFALCIAISLPAQSPELSLSAEGAVVSAGALGQFTVPAPSIETADQKELTPTYELDAGGNAQATYADGSVLKITMSKIDLAITYTFKILTGNATSLKFVTLLPINLNQGGRFALAGKTGEFPAVKAGQFLSAGDASHFDVIHPLGEGIRFSMPAAYHQLQDNRLWDWNVFAWIYRYDLKRYPGKATFDIKLASLASEPAAADAPPVRKFIVDRFGQSVRKDYPGKVIGDDELKNDIAKQKAALGSYQGPELDHFGGLAGSGEKLGLKKTGFFHTAVLANGRHTFVTPEGNAFFQLAVCGIANTDDYTTVKGRERVYEWVPDVKAVAWTGAWRSNHPDWGVFSFQIANWIRKYGKPYSYEEWTGQAVERLRAWGFNSAGAFSSYSQTMRALDFPAVDFLPTGEVEGVKMLPDKVGAGELMDPFAPGAEKALDQAYAGIVAMRAADPLLIGYFLGNEQHFETLP
jgi:hypothetical protein